MYAIRSYYVLDLVGSVTAEVMDQAKVPVLAIPEDFEYTVV